MTDLARDVCPMCGAALTVTISCDHEITISGGNRKNRAGTEN